MRFHPMPVVVISSLAQPSCRIAVEALELGAVEVLAKPGGPYSIGGLRQVLGAKVRAAAAARLRARVQPGATAPAAPAAAATALPPDTVIAIGASTGGTEAIASVLSRLPASTPAILIAQHIPPHFSRAFAQRLNQLCAMEVREAVDGEPVRPGVALVAPGDYHLLLRRSAAGYYAVVKTGPRVCYQRPSVDVLFQSVAEAAGERSVGALLTGMGSDGAQGLLRMRRSGAHTIAQDESSCVVFGMPREAIALGAAASVVPLHRIPEAILAAGTAKPGARSRPTDLGTAAQSW
jgi:two-component system chemotaxis response regulator CheB